MTLDNELASALENRGGMYRMLGRLYFQTLSQEQIDAMAQADFSAFDFGDEEMAHGFYDIQRYLMKRNSGTRDALAVDFTSAFLGTHAYGGKNAVPYESAYTGKEQMLMQEARQQVYTDYKRQALRLRGSYDLPDDHLSFEMEYMAILAERAARAGAEGAWNEALRNLLLSQAFLREHLLSWFGPFSELAGKLLKTRFYRGVVRVSGAWLTLDEGIIAEAIDAAAELAGIDPADMVLEPAAEWVERYAAEGTEAQAAPVSTGPSLSLW